MNDETNELTFASYRRTLRSRNRSEKTIESYAKAIRELERHLGGADVTLVSKTDLEVFFEKRLTEVSGTSMAIVFRSLRAFFNWCAQEEIVTASPMAGMTEPKATTKLVPVVPDDDLRALIKSCAGTTMVARRDEAVIRILCEPGSPRLGELAAMRVDDVDSKRDLYVVNGKTGPRSIGFGSKTGTAIDRYLRLRRKHPQARCPELWIGAKGALTPSGLAQMLERRSLSAGLGRIYPHQLRHTSASRFLENGGSEADAVVLFGWTDATMIHKVYGRSAAVERAHKAARRLSLGDRL